jgi:CRISPR system Cascade subunit CasE
MTLHLLRFDPDMLRVAAWLAAERLTPAAEDDDGYGWHALLVAAFGKDMAPKPFRLLARRGRAPQLLAYAQADAVALRARAGEFADPKAIIALGVETLDSKPMPVFAAGRRLGFSVRVRPTVRTDRAGDRTKSRELDAYVAARQGGSPAEVLHRQDVYASWVRQRLHEAGVKVESLRLDGLESATALRRAAAGPRGVRSLVHIRGHSVVVAGVIRIADADRFATLLARGLGRHRAFGYGMMLLSPPEA